MKTIIAIIVLISLASCAITRLDTLENCTMESEQFLGWSWWRLVDCSSEEDTRRESKGVISDAMKKVDRE